MDNARRERLKDLLLAAVLLAVGIGGFLFVNPTGAEVHEGPGGLSWRSLPFLYSGLLVLLVVIFILSTVLDLWLIARGEAPRTLLGERPPVTADPVSDGRRVLTLISLIAFAAGLKAFGFAIATFILLFVMLRVFGRTAYLQNTAVALIGTMLLWVLFIGVLKLPIEGNVWDPVTPSLQALYGATGAR